MKKVKNLLLLTILVSISHLLQAQNLTQKRLANFKNFIAYVNHTNDTYINLDTIVKRYVDIDYILSDTDTGRITRRKRDMLGLSRGLKSMMAAFNHANAALVPFSEVKNVSEEESKYLKGYGGGEVYAYYPNGISDKEKCWLLFRNGDTRVVSWRVIDQGGYLYFLTLSLL